MIDNILCAKAAREVAQAYLFLGECLERGIDVKEHIEEMQSTVTTLSRVILGKNPLSEPVAEALRDLIPRTCLPGGVESYEELADLLVVRLSASVTLVFKKDKDLAEAV